MICLHSWRKFQDLEKRVAHGNILINVYFEIRPGISKSYFHSKTPSSNVELRLRSWFQGPFSPTFLIKLSLQLAPIISGASHRQLLEADGHSSPIICICPARQLEDAVSTNQSSWSPASGLILRLRPRYQQPTIANSPYFTRAS
jgi:hypothetical protein